ncbi:hypothetical protein KHA90_00980 [Flavobacterium psychroterrae]|uniref:Lipoprotein n=1 Tax=Flavobacterium psychroterrae TaxID=2133767 RepID=A0ABS5P6U2_9FLAO|nr:hypothetical protein [Flavobacterium psychroterrae]MBS7229583.1 hypothetical protein [Flavobacterium psychroterrae]
MKKIITVLILGSLLSCAGQYKVRNNKIKKENMEYFNVDKYKDWEIDNSYSPNETTMFLKKANDRVGIFFRESTIQIETTNIQSPYGSIKVYYAKNKSLKSILCEFYTINIEIYKMYDVDGKLIKEINYEAPYKFTLKDAINKIKKEYEIDFENLTQKCVLERFESVELDKKPLYTAYLRNMDNPGIMDYIVIDGTTGETLFKTDMALNGEGDLPPYYKYIESLKKAEEEKTAYYKTYKGKDYTKEEWEVFEEEWYKNYQEKKKSKGFWDDLFNKP